MLLSIFLSSAIYYFTKWRLFYWISVIFTVLWFAEIVFAIGFAISFLSKLL